MMTSDPYSTADKNIIKCLVWHINPINSVTCFGIYCITELISFSFYKFAMFSPKYHFATEI